MEIDGGAAGMPVEKLVLGGAAGLGEVELVCILLGTGSRGRGVMETAAACFHAMGGMRGLARAPVHDLMQVAGIGRTKASRIAAAVELGRRAQAAAADSGAPVRSSRDIFDRLGPRLSTGAKEVFMVLGMDSRGRVVLEHRAAEGTLNECPVTPRDVFAPLLTCHAAGAVLAHNHPSGDPAASAEDRLLTIRMCEAGRLLGVKVLDHVIIGAAGYFSFKDDGLI